MLQNSFVQDFLDSASDLESDSALDLIAEQLPPEAPNPEAPNPEASNPEAPNPEAPNPEASPEVSDSPSLDVGVGTSALKELDCIQSLGLSQIQRHLFLCADPTLPKCCLPAAGLQTWNYLKQRLKELALDRPSTAQPFCIYRTKVNCLRICQQGPILLVYPDGVWYANVTPVVMERILQEHILGNQVVTEYMFVQAPLLGASAISKPSILH